jgi:uncharacterized protein YgiM (DUF1202 family)
MKTKKKATPKKATGYVRYWGLTKVKVGQKLCWVSQQNKNGWSLGLGLGSHTVWLRNVRFASAKEVQRALGANVVFVELKDAR